MSGLSPVVELGVVVILEAIGRVVEVVLVDVVELEASAVERGTLLA